MIIACDNEKVQKREVKLSAVTRVMKCLKLYYLNRYYLLLLGIFIELVRNTLAYLELQSS